MAEEEQKTKELDFLENVTKIPADVVTHGENAIDVGKPQENTLVEVKPGENTTDEDKPEVNTLDMVKLEDGISANSLDVVTEMTTSLSHSVESNDSQINVTSESYSVDVSTEGDIDTNKDDPCDDISMDQTCSETNAHSLLQSFDNDKKDINASIERSQNVDSDNCGHSKSVEGTNQEEDILTVTNIQPPLFDDKNITEHKSKEGKGEEVSPSTTKQPAKAKSRSGRMLFCKIHLLDGQLYEVEVTKNATGKDLFEKVCEYLTLQEKDYFGLQYSNNNVKNWLNNEKKILKQVKGGTCVFDFSVKFYPPEPLSLLEDISRFQLCLQVRFDIFNGKLPCSFTTLAILGSYMVQAEVGNWDNIDEYEFGPGDSYLDKIEYAPDKSPEMRSKVHELHKTHKGLSPEEAELQYLENAKKLAMYGVDLHQARDSQGVKLMLGVCASGIQVYKDKLRINRFVWPAILKLSYKRNNFYVKKRPLEGEKDGETIGFKLENHKMAKRLWKTCVEHHAFFRLHESDPPKSSTFPRFNSRFRYSGRTQKQVRDDVEKVDHHPKFDRSNFKYSSMPQTNADGYPDSRDKTDQKNAVTTPSTESGPPPYYNQDTDGYNTMQSHADKPNSLGDMSEDRRDRIPGQGDAIEHLVGEGGDAATLEIRGKAAKKDKDKKDKKDKKKEKDKKLGKGDSSEDRTDKLGGDQATTGYNGGHMPGSAGLDSGKLASSPDNEGADSRKELGKHPIAETDIDGVNDTAGRGKNVGFVTPLHSGSEDRHMVANSQETDIDGDFDKYKGENVKDIDGKLSKKPGDDKRDDDKHDEHGHKKGDKSKRKESDKSKDKKSGFFGRLRSTKDKEAKKGKGKETDIDSPPTSPTNKKEVVIQDVTVVEEVDKMETITKTESAIQNQEVNNEVSVKDPKSDAQDGILITITETTVVKSKEQPEKITTKNTNQIIPDENIEDEVFIEEQKNEKGEKILEQNHVRTGTESLSSDSSDDEEVCGTYHIESPSDEKPHRTIVDTIVEEKENESLDGVGDKTIQQSETVMERKIEGQGEKKTEIVIVEEVKTETVTVHNGVKDKQNEIETKTVPNSELEIQKENEIENVSDDKKPIEVEIVTETVTKIVENNQNETEKSVEKQSETVLENDAPVDVSDLVQVSDDTNESKELDKEIKTEEVKKDEQHERKFDEKRDFDIVVSEQKSVSTDGRQIISVRSEKRTETIQKEEFTHTRRELKPEEFAKYEKEIQAAEIKRLQIEGKNENKGEKLKELENVQSKEEIKVDTEASVKYEKSNKTATDNSTDGTNDNPEDSVIEVKIVKSDTTLEENVEKMKYIDESSGDSEKIKQAEEPEEVVITVVNEEAGKDPETEAPKLDKKESIRLKKEEKEKEKKELAEKKETLKRQKQEEKERLKKEKQEEKERIKREKQDEKERKKKEKLAEKERKKKEKENKNQKPTEEGKSGIEEKQEQSGEKENSNEKVEAKDESSNQEDAEERVPTAIAMVMAKQKEEEKMEEIDLNDYPVEEVTLKEEPVEEKSKKHKKSKKDKKEKEKNEKPKKKHKSTGCFAFSHVPSSDDEVEEEKPVEEVKEEIVQQEVKPVEEEVKVIPKQKGKGLGWALPGMDELQKKGTKHEEDVAKSPTETPSEEAKAPIAKLTEDQDQPNESQNLKIDVEKQVEVKEEITKEEIVSKDESEVIVENEIKDSNVKELTDVTESSPKDEINIQGSSEKEEISVQESSSPVEMNVQDLNESNVQDTTESNIEESKSSVEMNVQDSSELNVQNPKAESPIQDSSTMDEIEVIDTCSKDETELLESSSKNSDQNGDKTEDKNFIATPDLDSQNKTEVIDSADADDVTNKEVETLSEVGYGADGEMIGRVLPEGEGSIDRRMQFIPVTPPVQETKDSLKHSENSRMPFFDPSSEDTLGRKVPPPVPPKGMKNGYSDEDRLLQDMPPTIPTESFKYENNTDDIPISTKNVPYVKTKTQTVTYEKDGYPYETEDGILISSQSHSTRTQTIETTTYKTEKDGKVETRVEKKVVITDEGDDDDLDHDDLLAEAIRSVTEMNPDLSVERIECMRQIEEVEK